MPIKMLLVFWSRSAHLKLLDHSLIKSAGTQGMLSGNSSGQSSWKRNWNAGHDRCPHWWTMSSVTLDHCRPTKASRSDVAFTSVSFVLGRVHAGFVYLCVAYCTRWIVITHYYTNPSIHLGYMISHPFLFTWCWFILLYLYCVWESEWVRQNFPCSFSSFCAKSGPAFSASSQTV